MFASYGFQYSTGIPGSALLICMASSSPEKSCDYSNPNYIIYQENGGTSAASPMTAGIMALIVQKTGSSQGLANPVFYSLAAKENYSKCNSNTVQAGNSCIFYDTTSGSNAMTCYTGDTDCVTGTSGDQAGVLTGYSATTGYDLTTGLGTFNVANLVNAWPGGTTSETTTSALTISPTTLAVGAKATLTATVTAKSGTPTGTVNFQIAGSTFASATLSGGKATLTASSAGLDAGTYPVTASYAGVTGFDASNSPTVNVKLTKATSTTKLAASATSVNENAKVTLTATVTSTGNVVTGKVNFYYATELLGSANVSGGKAALTATAAVPAGSYAVDAVYEGSSSISASTSGKVTVTVK